MQLTQAAVGAPFAQQSAEVTHEAAYSSARTPAERVVMTSEGIEPRVAAAHSRTMKTQLAQGSVNGVFAVDAVLSAALGGMLLAFAPQLRLLSGAGLEADTLRWIGLLLLPWALHNYRASREAPLSTTSFAIQAAGDAVWLAGSLALCALEGAQLSVWGWLLYAPQALLVCMILALKLLTYRRSPTTAVGT
jgi:hypothetical protein